MTAKKAPQQQKMGGTSKKRIRQASGVQKRKPLRRIDIDGKLWIIRFLPRKDLGKCSIASRRWKANIRHYSSWIIKGRRLRQRLDLHSCPHVSRFTKKGLAYADGGSERRWQDINRYKTCCQELKAKCAQLVGQLVSMNAEPNDSIWLMVHNGPGDAMKLKICNQLTEHTSFALVHFLSHMKGFAFRRVGIYDENVVAETLINPQLWELLRDFKLDIRCEVLDLVGLPNDSTKRVLKGTLKPGKLVIDYESENTRPLFEFITEGKEWCRSLEVYSSGSDSIIDDCIKYLRDVAKKLRLEPTTILPLDEPFAWPTLCPLPDGDAEEEWLFYNVRAKQKFKICAIPEADGAYLSFKLELLE